MYIYIYRCIYTRQGTTAQNTLSSCALLWDLLVHLKFPVALLVFRYKGGGSFALTIWQKSTLWDFLSIRSLISYTRNHRRRCIVSELHHTHNHITGRTRCSSPLNVRTWVLKPSSCTHFVRCLRMCTRIYRQYENQQEHKRVWRWTQELARGLLHRNHLWESAFTKV